MNNFFYNFEGCTHKSHEKNHTQFGVGIYRNRIDVSPTSS